MAIESGRLVTGPVKRRDFEQQFYISYITNTEPGFSRTTVDENGALVSDLQQPEFEGQITVWKQANEDPFGQAYVAVNVSGALRWARVVRTLELLDARTGASWDPLAPFYNPLAS